MLTHKSEHFECGLTDWCVRWQKIKQTVKRVLIGNNQQRPCRNGKKNDLSAACCTEGIRRGRSTLRYVAGYPPPVLSFLSHIQISVAIHCKQDKPIPVCSTIDSPRPPET